MKTVRIVFVLLALSALALVSAQTKPPMTVWGGKGDVDTYTERLQAAMAQYPDIEVQLIYIPTDYDQKVQTMVAGATPPTS